MRLWWEEGEVENRVKEEEEVMNEVMKEEERDKTRLD